MTSRATAAERRARREARRAERADVHDPAVVLGAAAAFLAVRPRSIEETRRRLRHLGYPAAPIEVALERLLAYGYLDDEAFARSWVESRDRARPRGATALRRELRLKGIEPAVIDAVLAERELAGSTPVSEGVAGELPHHATGPDEVAARRLLVRRSASLRRETDPRKRRQKAYALLARGGFDPDLCARLSRDAAGADVTDEWR